ncbi:MAG TPA: gamma-glutamyltransferase [Holophaga sp.]|nr:gamma-glutamyltransferase [Holophaga sp.]HPS66484.1 gamma-glutamyltransferase [Holophaga sp.]
MTNTYNDFRVTMSAAGPGQVSLAEGRGAVATAARQASELAVQVLQDGGNAFDAAFATAFSLCIYHPQAGNLGGGGYLLFQEKGGRPQAFNYREQAPMGARREAFLLPDGNPDPDKTAFGPCSVCVPGTVKAFFELHARHGKLKAADLLLEVARRAEEGAVVTQYEADCLNRLAPRLAVSPEARRIYVRDTPYQAGDVLPNPALAGTLRLLAREGERAFYRGRIAEQIAADLGAHGGFLSERDLADYAIREVEPLSAEIAGRQVWTVPPEGGGAMLLEILEILDREAFRRLEYGSPEYYHYLAQASKRAFVDRMDYLGDVPLGETWRRLLARENADRLFALIDPARDTPTDALAGGPRTSGKDTTHFAIIDAEGNAVSNSYTMNLRYGSKWAVAGAGFLLNGSLDSFSFVEGKENYFGVIGSAPNLFAPGKRPASNMAPVLVTSGAEVEMVLGTPGGPTIPTTLANILVALLLHGVDPEALVRASRLHHQGWPDVLAHEPGFDRPGLLEALAGMGYPLKDKHELIADVHGVFRKGGRCLAVSDYRREGKALALP